MWQLEIIVSLNQQNDITMNKAYSEICGITRKELEANYDGYHFHPAGAGMFNPFSILSAFFNQDLGNYWFLTGTPTFLVEMLQQTDYDLRLLLDGIEAPASSFTEYRVDSNNPIPLIYQSGYLTIKKSIMTRTFI